MVFHLCKTDNTYLHFHVFKNCKYIIEYWHKSFYYTHHDVCLCLIFVSLEKSENFVNTPVNYFIHHTNSPIWIDVKICNANCLASCQVNSPLKVKRFQIKVREEGNSTNLGRSCQGPHCRSTPPGRRHRQAEPKVSFSGGFAGGALRRQTRELLCACLNPQLTQLWTVCSDSRSHIIISLFRRPLFNTRAVVKEKKSIGCMFVIVFVWRNPLRKYLAVY